MENYSGSEVMYCRKCKQALGAIISVDGEQMLQVGGTLIVRSIHSSCRQCGSPFHWVMSDRVMERVIRISGGGGR